MCTQNLPNDYPGNTPMMQQYFATRKEHPGFILLMRVGDFYEAYNSDAELIARDLELTLTRRDDGGTWVVMAGIPWHATERFIARLIRKGHRVAILDHVEDPKCAKGMVKRKVTQLIDSQCPTDSPA